VTAACAETAAAYGCQEVAGRWRAWLDSIGHAPAPDPPDEPRLPGGAVRSARLARAAVLWYRQGRRARADRAMAYLEDRQARDGGFRGAWGRGLPPELSRPDTWTAKHYLDAALLRVRAAFDAAWMDLPDRIDPDDGRVRAVRDWMATLPPDARVADVGCGRGRFLRHLAAWFPEARLVGIDLSPAMLGQLPPGVEARQGSLLEVPAADGELDGAFAVESLEHALLPERAVAELCRAVRPAGRVLIVDKRRARQALSEHEPWERWFEPEELARWLARACRDVTVLPVSHGEGRAGHNLFLAAAGTRGK
jgi:malonyl-CoA O-methyltransferase